MQAPQYFWVRDEVKKYLHVFFKKPTLFKSQNQIFAQKFTIMFGNMFGDLEKKQQEMAAKAAAIIVETEVEGIKVTANGQKEVINISITDSSVLNDKEQLEDLLVVAVNRALEEAGEKAAFETEKMMQDMLPPGFGDMFK